VESDACTKKTKNQEKIFHFLFMKWLSEIFDIFNMKFPEFFMKKAFFPDLEQPPYFFPNFK